MDQTDRDGDEGLPERTDPLLKYMEALTGHWLEHGKGVDLTDVYQKLYETSLLIYLMCTPESDFRANDRARVSHRLQDVVTDMKTHKPNDVEKIFLRRIEEHAEHINS